jgi:hypothetical protein
MMPFPQAHPNAGRRICFRIRLLIYLGVWLLAALAIQLMLRPEGLIESDLTPLQQRFLWPLYIPVMVALGLAQAFTWPDFPGAGVSLIAGGALAVHAAVALTRVRRGSFLVLTCVQGVFLVAVVYFVRQSELPSGS